MKKFIYLISPQKINKNFYSKLNKVLASKNIKFFQLRLKNTQKSKIIIIANKVKVITKKFKVKLIINDYYDILKSTQADGCHLGQLDGSVKYVKKKLKKKIVGVTCHNSKLLALKAVNDKADYVAFGAFNKSKLKPNAIRANFAILKWAKKNIKKPVVAIGGINNLNYKNILKCGANYIALSSYIWDNPKLKPEAAIRNFK